MDVFNLQAKIGLNVDEYLNGIKNAVNNSKKLVDAVNKMAEQAATAQTQTDKTGKSMQGAAENADALGKSVKSAVAPIDKMGEAMEEVAESTETAKKTAKDYKSDVMKLAAEFRKQGMDSSEALSKAYSVIDKNQYDFTKGTKKTTEALKEQGEQAEKTSSKTDDYTDSLSDLVAVAKEISSKLDKVGDETKKSGDEAEKSGLKFEKFGEKLKSAAEKVGQLVTAVAKVSTAVVGAASAGLTAITKQSIDAYSTYEQLVGGIEAAFEGNQKAIDTVLATGKDAWKTLAMSSNDYFNAFMAAYPLVKSGMADQNMAIETTNKLMQLEAGLANTFGYTAENAANAINWALKGTYSYLDNLNIGIKGTKEGFLEAANASGLFNKTFESVDDMTTDQQIDVIMHYAEAYGVLDRTANGAAGTLEGSSKALKAAWENLLAGFGREDADLKQLSHDLMTSVSAVASNFAPRIGQVLERIGATLPVLIPQAYEEAKKLISDNAGSFVSGVSAILTSGAGVIGSILEDVVSVLPEKLPEWLDRVSGLIVSGLSNATTKLSKIGEIGGNLISLVLDGLEQNLPDILSGLNDFFGRLIQQIPKLIDGEKIGELIPIIVSAITDGLKSFSENADLFLDAGLSVVEGILNGVFEALPILLEKAPVIIENLVNAIADHIDDAVQIALMIFDAINEGILGNLDLILDSALTILQAVINGIVDNIDGVLLAAQEIIITLVDYLLQPDTLQTVIEAGTEILKELFVGLGKMAGSVLGFVYELMGQLDNSIAEWIAGGSVERMGIAILDGIIAGLTGVDGSFFGEFKDNFITGLKSIFGIHSPSKVMEDEVGTYIGQGLLDGFLSIDFIKEFGNKIDNIISNAKTWGTDLMDNFVNGIKSKWNALVSTITSVAQTVKNYLGFSEPKVGPLSNFHTYAPDMMELFAQGIRDNERLISDQFDKSLGMLEAPEMTAKMNAETVYSTSGYNQAASTAGGTETILTLLRAILQAVREGRIVAIDDAGFRTINEGLARIQRFDEGGAFV